MMICQSEMILSPRQFPHRISSVSKPVSDPIVRDSDCSLLCWLTGRWPDMVVTSECRGWTHWPSERMCCRTVVKTRWRSFSILAESFLPFGKVTWQWKITLWTLRIAVNLPTCQQLRCRFFVIIWVLKGNSQVCFPWCISRAANKDMRATPAWVCMGDPRCLHTWKEMVAILMVVIPWSYLLVTWGAELFRGVVPLAEEVGRTMWGAANAEPCVALGNKFIGQAIRYHKQSRTYAGNSKVHAMRWNMCSLFTMFIIGNSYCIYLMLI